MRNPGLVLLLLTGCAAAPAPWSHDSIAAFAQARAAHVDCVVYFALPGRDLSDKMEREALPAAEVQQALRQLLDKPCGGEHAIQRPAGRCRAAPILPVAIARSAAARPRPGWWLDVLSTLHDYRKEVAAWPQYNRMMPPLLNVPIALGNAESKTKA